MIGPLGFSSNDRSIKDFLAFDKQPMTCRNYVQLLVMKSFEQKLPGETLIIPSSIWY